MNVTAAPRTGSGPSTANRGVHCPGCGQRAEKSVSGWRCTDRECVFAVGWTLEPAAQFADERLPEVDGPNTLYAVPRDTGAGLGTFDRGALLWPRERRLELERNQALIEEAGRAAAEALKPSRAA